MKGGRLRDKSATISPRAFGKAPAFPAAGGSPSRGARPARPCQRDLRQLAGQGALGVPQVDLLLHAEPLGEAPSASKQERYFGQSNFRPSRSDGSHQSLSLIAGRASVAIRSRSRGDAFPRDST